MRRTTTRRPGGRAGAGALLLLALSAMTMIFAANASAFTDVNTITGAETWPKVTQSTSVVANKPGTSQVLVAYNDGRGALESPVNYLGVSVSNNNGETFTRLPQPTQFTGHGTGYGSPILAWDAKRGKWIVGQLSSGCGGKGIGLWTSTNGETWTVGACAHSGTNDAKPSMWVDNNPSSPRYGRIYITFNNMAASGADVVTRSDDATTWTAPKTIYSGGGETPWNVNVTGSPGADGTVWAAMSLETSTTQKGFVFRSTDGGETWNFFVVSNAALPGSTACGGIRAVAPTWTHANWGQIATGPAGAVGYVWARADVGDEGDVWYSRYDPSTGTFGSVKLNTDATKTAQWAPSLRIGSNGVIEATWYDRRNSTNGTNYQRFVRFSYDGGKTWEAEEPLSPTLSPQPSQPNPSLPACGNGDYNLASAGNGLLGYDTWTDGRVAMEGQQLQKVFFRAASLKALPVAITEPAQFVAITSAELYGKVNPRGRATTYKFEYGTTTAYGSSTASASAGSGATLVSVNQSVSALAPATTYHFRIVATNSEGTTYGADRTFITN